MFKVLSHIRKWLTTFGAFPVWDWTHAIELYKTGNYEQAAILYQHGLESHPHHPAKLAAQIDLAECLLKLNRLEDAETLLNDILNSSPKRTDIAVKLAHLYNLTGFHTKEALIWQKIVEKNPEPDYIASFVLSVLNMQGSQALLENAVCYLSALNLKKLNAVRIEVARAILTIKKNNKEGLETLKQLAEIPNAPLETFTWLAKILLENNETSKAREYLHNVIASNHPEVYNLLAQSYLVKGAEFNPEFASQLALKACQTSNWLNPLHAYTLAQALHLMGDNMAALLAISKAKDEIDKRLKTTNNVEHHSHIKELLETLGNSAI